MGLSIPDPTDRNPIIIYDPSYRGEKPWPCASFAKAFQREYTWENWAPETDDISPGTIYFTNAEPQDIVRNASQFSYPFTLIPIHVATEIAEAILGVKL